MEEFNLDGIDLASDTAQADIIARVTKHEEGLKNKNTELIGREKTAKESIEAMRLSVEQEKHDLAKELATEKGSVADYKAALENEKEAMALLKRSFQEEKDKNSIDVAVSDFGSLIVDDANTKMARKGLLDTFRSQVEVKDGVVVPKDVATSLEDLTQALVSDKANAAYIKASVGSGLGSQGSDGKKINIPDVNEAAETAKKNGDGIGHLNAHLKRSFI